MNHLDGKPIAPTDIRIAAQWTLGPDGQWVYPMGAAIGFTSQQWPEPGVHYGGVNVASVQAGARPPLALDALPTLEMQLFAIISSIYDSNEVRMQLRADEAIYPPPPPPPEEPTETPEEIPTEPPTIE